jgi:hypothetical protein
MFVETQQEIGRKRTVVAEGAKAEKTTKTASANLLLPRLLGKINA